MNSITIIQHNVNSFKNKKFELYNAYRSTDPDIILLNHTGMTQQEKIKLHGYTTYQSNKTNSRYRGTAIAIKDNIAHTTDDEYITDVLALTIDTQQGPITIATDYIGPRATHLNYMDYTRLIHRQFPVYILGDLNAHHPTLGSTGSNPIGTSITTLIKSNHLQHLGPNFPTLIRGTGTTKPDIVLGNNKTYHNVHLTEGPFTTSDHMPIIAKITAHPIQIPIQPRLQYDKADWDKYKEKLSTVQVPDLTNSSKDDIDNHIKTWTQKIVNASNETIPKLQYRITPGIKPTPEIITIQRQYNAIRYYIRNHGTNNELYSRLTYLRRKLRDKYIKLQDQTWNKLMDKTEIDTRDPKKFWSSIKRFSGNTKQKTPYLRDQSGNKLHTHIERELLFKKHWENIFKNDQENDSFDTENITLVEDEITLRANELTTYSTSDLSRLTDCPEISITELSDIIKRTKQKTPGPSTITTYQLKNLPINMLIYLCLILNHTLSLGYFPNTWKTAIMIFIPKPGTSQHQVENYRPISLLDAEGKIFDRLINRRFNFFTQLNNHLNPRQHGFRQNRGTDTAIATLYEKISNNIALSYKTDIVLRDVSKAFDKIWHNGLRYKLLQTNIHTCLLKTISNFLDNRQAKIRIEHHKGDEFRIHSGVPQGACISPTLYSFQTHDIEEPDPNSDYIAYADDITQTIRYKGPGKHKTLAKKTKSAIQKINRFEKKWKIKTNTNKFKIIPISRRLTDPINIDGNRLSYTTEGKVLGLKLTTTGITRQVEYRRQIALANLNKIQRFNRLKTKTKLRLYKALVRPALTYPIIPMNTYCPSNMKKLQRVQNRALRFATNTKWDDFRTSRSLHEETNMEPINIYIHRLSSKTWQKIQDYFPQTYTQLKNEVPSTRRRNIRFPSSRIIAEANTPTPIYK